MPSRTQRSAEAEPSEADRNLTELGRALVAPAPVPGEAAPLMVPASDSGAEVELRLDDLIRDDNGEVVFFNDSGFRSLGITTDAAVVDNGHADPHRTAGGADVTGFQYVTFENGLTLYYQDGLDLIVHHGAS